MQAQKYSFDHKYNGHEIKNPFDSDNARYYVIETNRGTYLQTSSISGNVMITDDNFEELSSNHISIIEEEFSRIEYNDRKFKIKESLIAQSDISLVDLEGVTFTNEEVGDIILKRVFGGNPHAQIALQSKYLGVLTKLIKKESLTSEDNDILSEAEDKRNKVNEVRAKFSLSDI